jgi:hypothetical protein
MDKPDPKDNKDLGQNPLCKEYISFDNPDILSVEVLIQTVPLLLRPRQEDQSHQPIDVFLGL